MISEIDYESIADYLIEFDNLDIKADIIIKEEQGIKILKDYFETLNDKDKNTLYLITFFNNIINNYNQYILEDYYKTILNPVNVLVKIKLFKDIDFSSIKNFGNSVKETINKIDKIKQIEMPCNIVGYFVGEKIMNKELFICSSNKSCMPKLNSNNPCTYIVLIKKGTLVNYVPSKLTIDIIKDDKIVLKEDNPLFIFSSKKNKILDENSDIIKVSKIKILEKKTTDIITVNKIKIEEINCYKKIEVERNDNNG